MVWDSTKSGGDRNVHFASGTGGVFSQATQVHSVSSAKQWYPDIAVTSDGNHITVVWDDMRGGDNDIYMSTSPEVNHPPRLNQNIPSNLGFNEDGESEGLIDISIYFSDVDTPDELTYSIIKCEPNTVEMTLNGSKLDFKATEPDWYGTLECQVRANDPGKDGISGNSDDYHKDSNIFNVQVRPKNDDPFFTKIDGKNVNGGDTVTFTVKEDEWFNITIEGDDIDKDYTKPLQFSSNNTPLSPASLDLGQGEQPYEGTLGIFTTNREVEIGTLYYQISIDDKNGTDEKDFLNLVFNVENTNDAPEIKTVGGLKPVNGKVQFLGENGVDEGESLVIDVVASDPDPGEEVSVTTDYEHSQVEKTEIGARITYEFPYGDPGEKNIEIDITDGGDSSVVETIELTVMVNDVNDPPYFKNDPPIHLEGNGSYRMGEEVYFFAQGKDAEGSVIYYIWDFGDGSNLYQGERLWQANHTYQKSGNFTITVEIKDDQNAISKTNTTIRIYESAVFTLTEQICNKSYSDKKGDEYTNRTGLEDKYEDLLGVYPSLDIISVKSVREDEELKITVAFSDSIENAFLPFVNVYLLPNGHKEPVWNSSRSDYVPDNFYYSMIYPMDQISKIKKIYSVEVDGVNLTFTISLHSLAVVKADFEIFVLASGTDMPSLQASDSIYDTAGEGAKIPSIWKEPPTEDGGDGDGEGKGGGEVKGPAGIGTAWIILIVVAVLLVIGAGVVIIIIAVVVSKKKGEGQPDEQPVQSSDNCPRCGALVPSPPPGVSYIQCPSCQGMILK